MHNFIKYAILFYYSTSGNLSLRRVAAAILFSTNGHNTSITSHKRVGTYCKISLKKDIRLKWRRCQNEEIIDDVNDVHSIFISAS